MLRFDLLKYTQYSQMGWWGGGGGGGSNRKSINHRLSPEPKTEGTCNFILGEKSSFKLYAELQLIIVKRNRVIIKYKRDNGNPNITFHNFVY